MKIFFVQFFCAFLPPLLNLFASLRSLPFLSFIVPIFAWNITLVSPTFLKISLVFPILFLPSISLHCLLTKAFLSLLAILWKPVFSWVYHSLSPLPFTSLLFSAICKTFLDNDFAFLHFIFFVIVLFSVSCTMLWTSIHSFSGSLSATSNPLNLFVTSTV